MEDYEAREYCRKCGSEMYPFSRKYSVSSGEYFCVKCAEKTDSEYLAKHSCSVCKRLLAKDEVKLVMPSKVYGSEQLALMDRLVCTACYKQIGNRTMDRRSFRQKMAQVRANIRKGIIRRAAQSRIASA